MEQDEEASEAEVYEEEQAPDEVMKISVPNVELPENDLVRRQIWFG